MGYIVDISKYQNPSAINYDVFCSQLDMAIIRVQYGSNYVDPFYKSHIQEMAKRNTPWGVYAWVRGVSVSDMETEANDFYNRSKDYNPSFYVLDVEEKSMADMRSGINAYIEELRKRTDKKIGVYIANHLYKVFNLDLSKADFVWIPHYGKNNGQVNSTPDYPCDLHQYTSVGKLNGCTYDLDLSRLMNGRTIGFFTGDSIQQSNPEPAPNPIPTPTTSLINSNVKSLQYNLNRLFNAGLVVDGINGVNTTAKINEFGSILGVKDVNGLLQATNQILSFPLCKIGSKGYAVKYIQYRLGIKPLDGDFGKITNNSVFIWQKSNGLSIDGIVGIQSWKQLMK